MTEQEQAHFDKYEELFKKKPHVLSLIPFTQKMVKRALSEGDIHLNTLPLAKWDGRAPLVGWTLNKDGKLYSTLAEQVCLLKHAAIHHFVK